MQEYTKQLENHFKKYANQHNAAAMAKYMRNQFLFLGIKTPQRKQILKEFQYIYGKPPTETFPTIIWELWQLPQREFQYCAMNFLQKRLYNLKENSIELIEKLITTKSWWDTVDFLASNIIGDLFQRFPLQKHNYLQKWLQSENIWLQRTCILFQLKYKDKTDVKLLFSIITYLKDTNEFFLNKAIGWSLRQYSKTDAAAVINFTKNNKLSNLSQREAIKWLKKNNPED